MAEASKATTTWKARLGVALKCRYRDRIERREEQLAARATDRVVREFEWGLEWTRGWPCTSQIADDSQGPAEYLARLSEAAVHDDGRFFGYRTPSDFRLEENLLRFTSAVATPFPENNTVIGQWFPAKSGRSRAVLVLPHCNAKAHQHAALCRG